MFLYLRLFWFRLRSRFQRDALDRELAEELRVHAEFLEDEARRAGATAEEAQRVRAGRLGNMTNIRENTREHWTLGALDALLQDTKYAFRFLRRSPAFTAVAVLSLALGIGANATVFTVADRLLFSAPAHVANADALSMINIQRIYDAGTKREFGSVTTIPEFLALKEQARTFASASLYMPPERRRIGRGLDAPRVKESLVTTDFFDVLGAQPAKGRFFLPDDDNPDQADHAAVISYGFWQRYYSGSDSALGARLSIANLHSVIVGIAPRGFTGLELDAADVWMPFGAAAPTRLGKNWKSWDGYVPRAFVRLKPGIAPATAAAEATVIVGRVIETNTQAKVTKNVALGSIIQARGPSRQSAEVEVSTRLVVASAIVLLAACANLANLLLVRALNRRREIALRLAIGISRQRLVMQMLIEALMLGILGALGAVLIARWGGSALRNLVFPEMQWATSTFDVRIFVFAVCTALLVAAIATMAPAIRMTRADVAKALKSAAPQLASSTGRLRQVLLTVQVAMSVLLIVGATAFSRSLTRAHEFDMGVDLDRLLTMRFSVEADTLSLDSRMSTLEEAARRIRLVNGVEGATLAGSIPLMGNTNSGIFIRERELPPKTFASFWHVTPELRRIMGFRLVRGRWITDEDVGTGMPAPVLISESGANQLWPGVDPIGRCIRFGPNAPCTTVVGVIRDLRTFSFRDKAPIALLYGEAKPKLTEFFSGYVVIRTNGTAPVSDFTAPIRKVLLDLRPDLRSLDLRPLAQTLDYEYRPLILGKIAFGSFAILAIVLASVGLYGILAFSVTQRTGEFGIRAALGARAGNLVMNVVKEGVAVVAIGLLLGAAMSWYASTAIATLLFEASARDTTPYLIATVVLGVVALVASAVPAWRASSVDPATALRAE